MRRLITIAGPDGAGKSAVADALVERLEALGPVVRFHHRLRRPYEPDAPPVPDPQDQVPYSRALSVAKVVYLWVDWVLGWLLRCRPVVGRGGWVIVERGWWDLLVDPARYRLRPSAWIVRLLGGLRPGGEFVVVLHAPAEVLLARKQELPAAEVDRQLRVWVAVAGAEQGVVVDVDRPIEVIVDTIVERIGAAHPRPAPAAGQVLERVPTRWVSMSTRKHDWTLPSNSRRTASTALMIHQPIRRRAQLVWAGARAAAGVGLLDLLPRGAPPELLGDLAPHIPPGGTVAVAKRKVGSRSVALIIDRDGSPAALVKLAADEAGVEKLAREVESVRRCRPLLDAPLSAPRIYHADRGIAVFEPVRWTFRRQPWFMPADLAAALGRFHVSDGSEHGGMGHGDVAPWNLLRTADGWSLIDWEDAGDGYPPFYDLFHFLVLSQSMLTRPDQLTVVAGVTRLEGWIGDAVRAYATGAGIGTEDVADRFDDFLVRIHDGPVERVGVRWATRRVTPS